MLTEAMLKDNRIEMMLDELTKNFSRDDVELLKAVLKEHQGYEFEVLQDLMGFTYRHWPVGVRKFVEDPQYLGLKGQVYPRILDDLEELFEGEYVEAVLTGSIGWGKALGLETRIPTPTGWTTMKDIAVGDYVLSDTGKPCMVIKATEVQYNRTCYRVKFSDGETVIADAEHQWLVSEWKDRAKASKYGTDVVQQVVTTEEMAKSLLHGRMKNWAIELAKPIDLPEQEFIVPPYVLGAWLGDGTADDGIITCYDSEIVEKIRECGYEVKEQKATEGRFTIFGLKAQLRELGVLGNKHIPIEYLRGSIAQRTELFCGLMDTDGNIEIGGRAEFTSMNKDLAEGVYELVASLGHKPVLSTGRATIKSRHYGEKYRVRFTPDTPVFCLDRKLSRQRRPGKQGSRNKRRYVIEVTPVESVPVRCIEVDSPSHLFLFGTTFIATHNSTFAEIAMARMIYEVSCFRNPQKVYGLMDGTVIAFINVSVSKRNAEKVVYHGIRSKLVNSPYFESMFPIEPNIRSELRLPNHVWVFPVASEETSVIGYNVFGGVMDEVNFMEVVENSKRSAGLKGGVYDKAVTLQEALIRRMKSRYLQKGKLPGILLQISSSKYPEDYTERRIEEAKEDPQIFVRRYAQWDTLPKERYSGTWFWVSLGDNLTRSKIVEDEEEAGRIREEGVEVLPVPTEYRRDFEKDIDAAIRDFAGRPTLTIRPFIVHRWKVYEAMQKGERFGLEHPFTAETTNLQDGVTLDPTKLLIPKLKKQIEEEADPKIKAELQRRLAQERARPRFLHIDLGTATFAGMAMGHVLDYVEVTRRNEDGEEYVMRMPVIGMDMMLRVEAPHEGEIEIAGLRQLVYELRSYGYRIKKVTFDQYQSKDSEQQLKRSGIEAGYLSADTDPGVYQAYKDAINEDRWVAYYSEVVYNETIRLEKNEKTGKVDHPPKGTKDVSDAVAGVCYHCVSEVPRVPAPPPTRGMVYAPEAELGIPIIK